MTSTVQPVDPTQAVGLAKTLLERLQRRIGPIPQNVLIVANSRSALQGYLSFFGALRNASIPAKVCEQVGLLMSELNGSPFDRAQHAMAARRMGLPESEIESAARGRSSTPKAAAALTFARALVESHGQVREEDLEAIRAAGYSDGQIIELIGLVALNTFANYVANATGLRVGIAKQ
ncbi:MAG TPA: hypothetical protein VMG41_17265 [Gemmatimonadales bacterium]|nr:hypothetical protein [Gemmatimonadales bacterium]